MYYQKSLAKHRLVIRICAKILPILFYGIDKTTMAIQSKYQDAQLDALLNDLIITLEKHKSPVDLSLMALGNMVTNILRTNIANPASQKALADAFCEALQHSLKNTQ